VQISADDAESRADSPELFGPRRLMRESYEFDGARSVDALDNSVNVVSLQKRALSTWRRAFAILCCAQGCLTDSIAPGRRVEPVGVVIANEERRLAMLLFGNLHGQ
jgi:hypothetical protein